jgi:hypothetical protein
LALCFPGADGRARFFWISRDRMPLAPAKVYRRWRRLGQRNHAKAGPLFPRDEQFRMEIGISQITR